MSGFSTSESLSNIELYYTQPEKINDDSIVVAGDEFYHIVKVMRHQPGDILHVTNGEGKIFVCEVEVIERDYVAASVKRKIEYENINSNKYFCVPRLKNPERFEFALEKCVELGITNFIVFESKRTIAKGAKLERWNKILLAAMKQSLRSFLPNITYLKSLKDIIKLNGEKIIFEQNAKSSLQNIEFDKNKDYYFIFGPEGGLDESELSLFDENEIYELGSSRLRSETAIIKAASLI